MKNLKVLSLIPALWLPLLAWADNIDITRASVSTSNVQGNSNSSHGSVSDDGRYVVFQSNASNLVGSLDTNSVSDIFLRDRQAGTTDRLSLSPAGIQGNGASSAPVISGGGRYVAFVSAATNLITSDSNGASDIFVYDLQAPTPTPAPSATPGRAETTSRVSLDTGGLDPNGASHSPVISSAGRYVAFVSAATDLVTSDTNSAEDVFVYDRQSTTTQRISLTMAGLNPNGASHSPALSADGRFVVFVSEADNIIVDDGDAFDDIFIYDRDEADPADALARLSTSLTGLDSNGNNASPSISDDGRYVVFESTATNLVTQSNQGFSQIYIYDRQAPTPTPAPSATPGQAVTTSVISLNQTTGLTGNGASTAPRISGDGRFVVFISEARNLINNDNNDSADIVVFDRMSNEFRRANLKINADETDGGANEPVTNQDGSVYVFTSGATRLVNGDTNAVDDVFIQDETCSSDSDGDSTVNCTDDCPFDATKTSAGSCGCGTAETDSDSDATPDCLDLCPSDASKIALGDCGCGAVDSDGNGNGVSDCKDPTSQTKPGNFDVKVSGKGISINLPREFSGVTFRLTLERNGRRFKQRSQPSSKSYQMRFRNLPSGSYRVFYKVILNEVTTKASRKKKFTIK